jgi:cellobiose phosphorylase
MAKSSFGHFEKLGTEFIVTEWNTPLPLINYYWNENFISGASQHMSGVGCFTERPMQYMHPECRCLIVRDENRHFYLRDDESGDIWSPGYYPAGGKAPDDFLCRHGLGYSILESSNFGIASKIRVFVPEQHETEIWSVELKNESDKTRTVKFYSFIDWLLTGYEMYCDYHSSLFCHWDAKNNALTGFNEAPERPHDRFSAFISSDTTPSGYDSSRRHFIGNVGSVAQPQAIIDGKMSNSLGTAEKICGALEHTFTLKPGESVSFNVAMGSTDSIETSAAITSAVLADGAPDKLFEAMKDGISKKYGSVLISTPEDKVNCLFNNWIKRAVQLHTEVGTDTGRGFRDVMQAAWAVSSYDPEGAKQKIIDSLRHQYKAGHTLRGWNPVDTHHYSDGPVWIAPAVDSYLKETGDYEFLDLVVPYFDEGEGTIWEHTLTSIRHSTDDLGSHGLIRMHYGDWNDSLNGIGIGGKGESAWTSIGMVFSINCALEIARNVIKDKAIEEELVRRAERLKETIHQVAWDGEWFLEGFNDAGQPVGSHVEEEGKVFLNPQTWAVLADMVDGERKEKCLRAVDELLECDYGSMVLTPAYKKPNWGIGRITTFLPGMWENAAPYCHGTAFKIVADTVAGRGDRAYQSMMKVLPDNPKNPSTYSGCPPYMVTNMYYGPEHPRPGQILYSWITGTADWLFKALTGYIIGVRADYDGLLIDPCMPSHWKEASLTRHFRGATYKVTVKNLEGKQKGNNIVTVDGKAIKGNKVPAFGDGKVHEIKVTL